jgi:DNA-binding NtrC family response regulator
VQILVVDGGDQSLTSQFTRLRDAGYEVTQAGTFEPARQILLDGSQHIDVLVTNLRLKAYNGLHLVSYTRSLCSRTAAIVVDRELDPVNELQAHRFGAGYISAHDAPEALAELVEAAIHKPRVNALTPETV